MKRSPQVEVPVLTGRELGEVSREVRWNESRHAGFDCRLQDGRLEVHDHVGQPRDGGDHAGRAGADLGDSGDVRRIDDGDRRTDGSQIANLLTRRPDTDERQHRCTPGDQ